MRIAGPPTSGRPTVATPERRTPRVTVDGHGATMKKGVVRVAVKCPRRVRTGASATVTLYARVAGRDVRLSSKTVDLGSGQRRTVAIKLSPRQRAAARAAGKKGLHTSVQVVNHSGVTGRQRKALSL